MILKAYFDGGNQEVPGQYKAITLAVAAGTGDQWNRFDEDWCATLVKHKADYLHTTDALALKRTFSRKNGWTKESVSSLLHDCVSVAERNLHKADDWNGINIVTLTVRFDDFARARQENPLLPDNITELCASDCLAFVFKWGVFIGADWFELYFDQGEPFYGHVYDRHHNKRSKQDIPIMKRIAHMGESDMRLVPALQLTDLFAWCGGHQPGTHPWHKRLNDLHWAGLYLGYEHLQNPRPGVLDLIKSWRLPPRKKKY